MTCARQLLIVPYGIETANTWDPEPAQMPSFNRTLWN